MMGLRGHSYQRFLRTKIGNQNLYSTKDANCNCHAFVQTFDLLIRAKSAPPKICSFTAFFAKCVSNKNLP